MVEKEVAQAGLKEFEEYDTRKEFNVGKKGKAVITKIVEGKRSDFFSNSTFGSPEDAMLQCVAENKEGERAVVTFKKTLNAKGTLKKFIDRYGALKAGVEVETVVDKHGKNIIEV